MNTEKFVVREMENGLYINKHCNFTGSMEDAVQYARDHNYGGGVVADGVEHNSGWKVDIRHPGDLLMEKVGVTFNGTSGAELYTNIMSEDEQEKLRAIARLIKAAPKLLEMLETIVILHRLHKNSTDWEKVLEEAAVLIKKARGE